MGGIIYFVISLILERSTAREALLTEGTEALIFAVVYGLSASFLYWIFYSFCVSLGYGEMLPPVLAAWTTNFIFLCFGVWTLLNAE